MQDLTVYYRMCGIPSSNPSPWSQEDKFKLNKVCLISFLEGMSDIKTKIHFLLDYCGPEYDKLIEKYTPDSSYEHSEVGINATMLSSYALASQEQGLVLFQECDYLYRPRIGNLYLNALKELDIVSPYDHKNFYIDHNLHSETCEIKLVNDCHFRSTERNTMTWGCHSDVIRENLDIFIKYGYLDSNVWYDLFLAGRRLWVPIPSFATHCVTDYLAPGTDWEDLWRIYQSV